VYSSSVVGLGLLLLSASKKANRFCGFIEINNS
jgi:hypothetical protein